MKILELTGKVFGRLTVLGEAGRDSRHARLWNVRCLCGTEKVMRSDIIRSKPSIGCGCGREVKLTSDDLIASAGDYHTHNNRSVYIEWRTEVIALHPKCNRCSSDVNLVAHHIVPVRDNPQIMFEVSNGGVLCNSCHRSFHAKYGNTGIGIAEWEKFTWK